MGQGGKKDLFYMTSIFKLLEILSRFSIFLQRVILGLNGHLNSELETFSKSHSTHLECDAEPVKYMIP